MKFSFRKIGSILASGAMLSSTVALAAAANYPAPFVSGGSADVAIVHGGANAQFTDLVAVTDISSDLSSELAKQTASGGSSTNTDSVSGEAYELFTSGSPLLMNSTLDSVRSTVSDSHLPTVLKDGIFETTTNVDFTQRINLGKTPRLEFKQQPTSSDDAQFGFSLSTTASTGYIYNATIIFESNVNLTHADSVGEELDIFGSTFTVGGATSSTKLVLLRTAETIGLSSDTNPSSTVTVDGEEYTIDLIAATDTSATIKVTDSTGASSEKEVNEANSKTIQGLEVTVDTADENNFRLTATVSVGSNRMTFQDGSTVKLGTEDKAVEGTQVEFYLTNDTNGVPADLGKIIVQVTTHNSDNDAIFPGGAFVDPVFGTFKVDFSGVSIPTDSTSDREDIEVKNSGNDKMTLSMQSHDGTEAKTVNWVINNTKSQISQSGQDLAGNSDGDRIIVREMGAVNKSEFVVVPSDKEGGLYQVTEIANGTTGYTDDYVNLKNVFTGEETGQLKATSEGTISGVTLQGKTYTITYHGAATLSQEARYIRMNAIAESTGQAMILFPSIVTSKGAKVAFYEPTRIQLDAWDNNSAYTNASSFEFQDGDGYGSVTITSGVTVGTYYGNYSFTFPGGNAQNIEMNTSNRSADGAIGQLRYNITSNSVDPAKNGGKDATNKSVTVFLVSPAGGNIVRPSLIIFEEKDDASEYQASVVTLDAGYDGDSAGIGVTDVVRTWSTDGVNDEVQLESNTDLYQDMDLWGTLFELDKSDSDQTTARISYPDEQVLARVYVGELDASISSAGGGGVGSVIKLGNVAVADTDVGSVSGKNLIVIGGSCVNSVAASLLAVSSPTCGADWTTATGVASGEWLIQSFERGTDKVATLVAGTDASGTTNAARALTTETVDTAAGKKYTGTTAASITSVMEDATADEEAA